MSLTGSVDVVVVGSEMVSTVAFGSGSFDGASLRFRSSLDTTSDSEPMENDSVRKKTEERKQFNYQSHSKSKVNIKKMVEFP